jgi:hypothetical protein
MGSVGKEKNRGKRKRETGAALAKEKKGLCVQE